MKTSIEKYSKLIPYQCLRYIIIAAIFLLLGANTAWSIPVLPTVSISEDVGGGIGEYTVDIQSPIGTNWYVLLFAAENEQSVLAGGDGAFVDNGIGNWVGNRFAPNEWQVGFDFEVDTPGGVEVITNTLDLGNFTDLFGTNTFAHAYWPTSYLDFSAGANFSLIGPNESRGGFKFHTPIVASNWVALVESDGLQAILTGVADDSQVIPEPTTMILLGFGLIGLAGVTRKKLKK